MRRSNTHIVASIRLEIVAIALTGLLSIAAGEGYAQYRQNFGLTRRQPDSTLPKGKAPFDVPVRKPKANPSIVLPAGLPEYTLHEGWELTEGSKVIESGGSWMSKDYNSSAWYDATVPGTVLTTLVEQGVYPDPYIGLNHMSIPDTLCRQDWWYRLAFTGPGARPGRRAWLHFDGINYKAVFYLNGRMLGHAKGAFKRTRFDVTDILAPSGRNVLAVHIQPPPNPGIPHEQSFLSGMGPNGGQLAMDGPTFISSEGWDWVPGIRDRNIGIWQPVRLLYTGDVSIVDPQVVTDLPLPDTSRATVIVRVGLKNHSDRQQTVVLKAAFEGVAVEQKVTLSAKEERRVEFTPATHPSLALSGPRLWWPNGYGAQNLYHLKLSVIDGLSLESDRSSLRFGVREFSYELMADAPHRKAWRFEYDPTDRMDATPPFDNVKRREFGKRIFIPSIRPGVDTTGFRTLPDADNPYLTVRVNGRRIFCRGGNWGMDDGMKKVTREKLEPYFQLHRDANYNMIRNWTGESTETMFFDLADEYGMLVFNDFWMSTEGYNLNPVDQHLFLDNTLDAIRRFRNHASLALWCPRNEGYAPEGIEEELYRQLITEDGTRHYIGNSREINLRQSGDWHYIEDPSLYFTKYAEGFSTEIGTFSVPVATTIRKFIKPEDQWPINDVWHYHDLHSNNQNLPGYLRAVDSLYGKPTGLDDFSRKVQLVNYESHRAIYEGWNHRMWDKASGVLLWMTHPAWPSMIWQTYSWDGETHGSFFGAKKACEPVHVQMGRHDGSIMAVNATLRSIEGCTMEYSVHGVDGKTLYSTKLKDLRIQANDRSAMAVPMKKDMTWPDVYLVRLRLTDAGGRLLSVNEYWKSSRSNGDFKAFNAWGDQPVSVKRMGGKDGKTTLRVTNAGNKPVAGVKLNAVDAKGTILLPAFFSDGYFNLMPGESREIDCGMNGSEGIQWIRTEAYNSGAKVHPIK